MNHNEMNTKIIAITLSSFALAFHAAAWDYPGHRAVNQLALASLPTNFPAFVLTPAARERIAFLAGEPDRWRNATDSKTGVGLALAHVNGPDHYLDMEDLKLYGLTPATLPPLRYDFVADIVKARAEHPDRFPAIDPAKDKDGTRELSGFLPWAITENYEKLRSDFTCLKTFENYGGTPEEIANAKEDILYVMGVMGHYVGDAGQPLHTTMYHHGWTTNDNPEHFTTSPRFHEWIDGGFFKKTGGIDVAKLAAQIRPATEVPGADEPNGVFEDSVNFLVAVNKLVVPLYRLDRDGKLSNKPGKGAEGRAFLEGQLVKSGQLLGDLWLTAWQTAPEDKFLERQLRDRAEAKAAADQ